MKSKVGDQKKAVCFKCESIQRATFVERDVSLSDGSLQINGAIVGVCDNCDSVVLTDQSVAERLMND